MYLYMEGWLTNPLFLAYVTHMLKHIIHIKGFAGFMGVSHTGKGMIEHTCQRVKLPPARGMFNLVGDG